MKLIVIIVTYNGSKWIDNCFGSLINSSIPVNILAIDNASTDGTPQIIRERFPQVEVIETGQNLGFGKANNIGLKRVLDENADYAFLLNQDAWVQEDTIEKLVQSHQNNPEYDLLSPVHLNGKGDAIDLNFQNYLGPFVTPNFYSDHILGQVKQIYEGKYVNAACWLLTKKSIEIVGFFDPLFKQYGEDDDFINRLHQKRLKLAIVPSTVIFHDRPQDGKMHESFYKNSAYTRGILALKNGTAPRTHFLIRRIVAKYFELYFVHLGKSDSIKLSISADVNTIKYRQMVKAKING